MVSLDDLKEREDLAKVIGIEPWRFADDSTTFKLFESFVLGQKGRVVEIDKAKQLIWLVFEWGAIDWFHPQEIEKVVEKVA